MKKLFAVVAIALLAVSTVGCRNNRWFGQGDPCCNPCDPYASVQSAPTMIETLPATPAPTLPGPVTTTPG